jgi:hypothetical protein
MSEYEWVNVAGELLSKRKKKTKHIIRKTLQEDVSKYYPSMDKEEEK